MDERNFKLPPHRPSGDTGSFSRRFFHQRHKHALQRISTQELKNADSSLDGHCSDWFHALC